MVLFHPIFMRNAIRLILALLISRFFFFFFFFFFLGGVGGGGVGVVSTFLVSLLVLFAFLSLFCLHKCLVIWLISVLVTKFWLPNFSNKGIGIITSRIFFSKFYIRHYKLVSKYDFGLKPLLLLGLSEPDIYGSLIYIYTVDSRYLEFQGTIWTTSIYPYLDISDLQNWGKNNSHNHI